MENQTTNQTIPQKALDKTWQMSIKTTIVFLYIVGVTAISYFTFIASKEIIKWILTTDFNSLLYSLWYLPYLVIGLIPVTIFVLCLIYSFVSAITTDLGKTDIDCNHARLSQYCLVGLFVALILVNIGMFCYAVLGTNPNEFVTRGIDETATSLGMFINIVVGICLLITSPFNDVGKYPGAIYHHYYYKQQGKEIVKL